MPLPLCDQYRVVCHSMLQFLGPFLSGLFLHASHICALKMLRVQMLAIWNTPTVNPLARPTSGLADIMDNDKLMLSIRLFELSFPVVAK